MTSTSMKKNGGQQAATCSSCVQWIPGWSRVFAKSGLRFWTWFGPCAQFSAVVHSIFGEDLGPMDLEKKTQFVFFSLVHGKKPDRVKVHFGLVQFVLCQEHFFHRFFFGWMP